MAPTLRPGQLVLTRSLRRTSPIRRGDLVIADSAELGRRVVKRVVGLAGERVTIAGGPVSVDGVALDEPYARPSLYRGEFHVPAGHFLLLGDDREVSSDARSWRQPYLARERLVGHLQSGTPHRRRNRWARTSRPTRLHGWGSSMAAYSSGATSW